MSSELVGYLRKSQNGEALKMSISVEAMENAQRYSGRDGREYVSLVANLPKTQEVINGERAVTSVMYLGKD